ncbi:hypothetical protein MXB_625 [Myxobolus squamalis]|nr:hypothetical protein MXB_625 [Myxobolus squamalis]
MTDKSKFQNCLVKLLDGDEFNVKLNVESAYGVALFDKVCTYLKISEKDYFSLRKTLKKQLKEGPYTFYFFVKFFPPDPCTLQEDLTRYLFVLAIRDLIFTGKLSCSTHFQLLLSSFIVQAEFGDWSSCIQRKKYLHGLKFVPNQPADFEDQLIDYHKKQTSLSPEEVETQYLKLAKDLELYGIELHDVKDNLSNDFMMGVSFRGLNLYENYAEQYKIFWPELVSASFFKKGIAIKVLLSEGKNKTLNYKCATRGCTKRLYRAIVEFHTFFRRPLPLPPVSGIALSSKFRYNGRKTYLQIKNSIPTYVNMGNNDTTSVYSRLSDLNVTKNTFENYENSSDESIKKTETKKIRVETYSFEYETQLFEAKFDDDGNLIDDSASFQKMECKIFEQDKIDSKEHYETTSTHMI